MKKILSFFLCFISINCFAEEYQCTEIKLLTNKHSSENNTPTQKIIELQNYASQQGTNKYYSLPLTRKQSQYYLKKLLKDTSVEQIDPVIFGHAIGLCDFNNINLYLDYGLNFYCYTQEGVGNIISFLTNCRVQGESKRNQVLERLLQAGINPNDGIRNLNAGDANIYPIAAATEDCDASMLDVLLKYEANPNLKTTGEKYFSTFNICYQKRRYTRPKKVPALGDTYPETPILPMAWMMRSLLRNGADPNTVYISNDKRNLATQDKAQVLAMACSGKDSQAKSLYDFYADELKSARIKGDPVQIDNYEKLFAVIKKYKAKPLTELCRELK